MTTEEKRAAAAELITRADNTAAILIYEILVRILDPGTVEKTLKKIRGVNQNERS